MRHFSCYILKHVQIELWLEKEKSIGNQLLVSKSFVTSETK